MHLPVPRSNTTLSDVREDVGRGPARAAVTAAAVVGAALLVALLGAPAQARAADAVTNPSGFVRVAVLTSGPGSVDLSVAPAGGAPTGTAESASYGRVTPYSTLAPGDYVVTARATGAAPTAAATSTPVTVAAGSARTVVLTGTPASPAATVVTDDLTQPAAGSARVRLAQGAEDGAGISVEAVGGPTLSRGLAYGAVTGYADVPQGRWTFRVTRADGTPAVAEAPVVDLAAGSLSTLVLLTAPDGLVTVRAVTDATGVDTAVVPARGVETGGGGTATTAPSWAPGVGLASLLLAGSGVVLARRPRTARSV